MNLNICYQIFIFFKFKKMDLKQLFLTRSHDGYLGKEDNVSTYFKILILIIFYSHLYIYEVKLKLYCLPMFTYRFSYNIRKILVYYT